jgi:hypothetical protein
VIARFAAATAAIAVALAPSVLPAPALAGDEAAAQEAVFGRQHLDNVTAPTTLRYTFRRVGTLLPKAEDDAALDVTAVQPDGRKRVAFRLFSGRNERRLEPGQGYRNNPLIVVFLQRDVEQMGRLTGGSPQYFRNRIREAFGRDGAVSAEPVTVAFRERRLEGTKVTVEPFARDPNLLRFPEYARKRYEFVLAPDIPGGVYSLRAVMPNGAGEEGEPLLDESMTYSGDG